MRRVFTFALKTLLALGLFAAAVVIGLVLLLASPKGPPLVEKLVNRIGGGLEAPFYIEGLGGALWRAPTLASLTVADSDGVWLSARDIRATWSFPALVERRPFITGLTIGSIIMHRRPIPNESDDTETESAPFRPASVLPYIPQTLGLRSIVIEAPVTGISHSLQGSIAYVAPGPTHVSLITQEGPATTLSGTVAIDADNVIAARLALTEQANGVLGGLMRLPASSLSATVVVQGPLEALQTEAVVAMAQPNRRATVRVAGPVDVIAPSATLAVSGTFVEGKQVFGLTGKVVATDVSASIPAFMLEGPGTRAHGTARWEREPMMVAGSVSATVARLEAFSAYLAPTLKGAMAFSANGKFEGETLEAAVDVSRLNLSYQGRAIRLAAPVRAVWNGDRGTLSPLRLEVAGGTLTAQGSLNDDAAQAKVAFSNLDVTALYPNPYATGRLNGTLDLTGTPQRPALAFETGFVGQTEGHAINAKADGTWRGEALAVKATASSGPSRLQADARVAAGLSLLPFRTTLGPTSALQGTLTGGLPLDMLNPYLWASRQHIEGNVTANLTLAGTLGEPRPTGTVRASNVAYSHGPSGVCVNGLNALLAGDTNRVVLQSLSAADGKGGTLSGTGGLALEGAKPLEATINLNNYGLFCGGIASGVVGGTLNATGTLADHTLAGKLRLGPLNIQIPGAAPTQKAIPHIETVRAGERQPTASSRPSRTRLDIDIHAPNQIFVRGRGLDAEFGGDLAVNGTTSRPRIKGSLVAERGNFVFFDRTLRLGDTSLRFEGPIPPSPFLNVNASSKVNGNTIGIALTGPATKPTMTLTSTPSLPQDEILAQLLFGRTLSTITPFQAIQLAQAARTLAGLDGGDPGLIGTARSMLGLDTLDVGTDTDNNVTVTTGKYLSDDIYLSIQQGAREQDREVKTEIELTPSVSGYTSVNGLGQQTFGVQWKRDY